jgi:hypothetical protein
MRYLSYKKIAKMSVGMLASRYSRGRIMDHVNPFIHKAKPV